METSLYDNGYLILTRVSNGAGKGTRIEVHIGTEFIELHTREEMRAVVDTLEAELSRQARA